MIPSIRQVLCVLALVVFTTTGAFAAEVSIVASQDNTLWEDDNGTTSNGAGENLFVGRNGGGQIRRAVLKFDVAAVIPGLPAPGVDGLLGMSFLKELDFSQQGNTLTLKYPEPELP